MLLKRLWFCPLGDMWQCLGTFGCYDWGKRSGCHGPLVGIEARDAAKHPATPRRAPPKHKEMSGPIPDGSLVKNTHASAGDMGSIPGSRKNPWRRTGSPLLYSCLGNPMDSGEWRGYSSRGHKDSDTPERLSNDSKCPQCQG